MQRVNTANKMGSKLIEDWRCPNFDDGSAFYDVGDVDSGLRSASSSSSKSSVGVRSSSPRRRTGSTFSDDDDDDSDTLLSLSTPVALVITTRQTDRQTASLCHWVCPRRP